MNEEYLNQIKIYLQQEMPSHRHALTIKDGMLVFTLPPDSTFHEFYEQVSAGVIKNLERVRDRKCDLDFKVWSKNQERDFRIFKRPL